MVDHNGILVRRAEDRDVKILTQLCKRAFDSDKDVGSPGPGGPPGYDSIEWNANLIHNQYLRYYKILFEDSIVGGFIAGDRGPGYQVCERIWVDPDHMRKGIGARTFELVEEGYPAADLWALGTPEWNTRTNSFYKKIGFSIIGKTHDYPTWNGNYYEKRISNRFPQAMSTIENLRKGLNQVVVEGFVDHMPNARTVTSRKTGEALKVVNTSLRDDTGSINLVLWNDQIRQVKAGTKLRIENGYVKDYLDELQLGIGAWRIIITLL